MELVDGIEPSTSPLPRECSTTELHEPTRTSPCTCSAGEARGRGPGHRPRGRLPPEGRPPASGERGAGDRIRTGDIQLGKLTLYQLSYSRTPSESRAQSEGDGGQGWIRTSVGIRQRIYSPSPLTTRAPTHVIGASTPGHSRIWSHPSESNRQPSDYKSDALPVELGWHPDGACPVRPRARRCPRRTRVRRGSVASSERGCQPPIMRSRGRPGRRRDGRTAALVTCPDRVATRTVRESRRSLVTGSSGHRRLMPASAMLALGGRQPCESDRSVSGRS